MSATPQTILCDGCGIAASPEHIRERLARLELDTRFRPIHIGVLFAAPSPEPGLDFYDASPRPSGSREILLDTLGIPAQPAESIGIAGASATESRLAEFQRRGFYFATVSECPLAAGDSATQAIARLAPTFLKRIQFSYKPKSVVLLSDALASLLPLLAATGQGIRILPDGAPLARPPAADAAGNAAFRSACARVARSERS